MPLLISDFSSLLLTKWSTSLGLPLVFWAPVTLLGTSKVAKILGKDRAKVLQVDWLCQREDSMVGCGCCSSGLSFYPAVVSLMWSGVKDRLSPSVWEWGPLLFTCLSYTKLIAQKTIHPVITHLQAFVNYSANLSLSSLLSMTCLTLLDYSDFTSLNNNKKKILSTMLDTGDTKQIRQQGPELTFWSGR